MTAGVLVAKWLHALPQGLMWASIGTPAAAAALDLVSVKALAWQEE